MNSTFTSFDRYLAIVAKTLALGGIPSNAYSLVEVKAAYDEGVMPIALASYIRDRYLDLELELAEENYSSVA